MVRARKRADVLTAKRKRVQRAIASLKKSITSQMPASERQARQSYIGRLERQLKQTYIGRIPKSMRTEAYVRANEVADKLTRQIAAVRGGRGKARERARSTAIFKQEMRAASKGLPSALGDMGREKVKIFWRYTQNVWQRPGVPPERRLEAIMKAYGADTLAVLFDTIMQRNEKTLQLMQNMRASGELQDDTDMSGGSPIYLMAVTPDVVR